MNGFKQLYSILLLLVVLLLLNIYKQTKRERNNKINSKKHGLDNLRTNHLEFERIRHQAEMRRLEEEQLKSYFLERMLEYSDKCYDIHILLFRPEINELNFDKIKILNDDDNNSNVNDKQKVNDKKLSDKKIEPSRVNSIASSESDKAPSGATTMETNGLQQNSSTNVAVYIFVICLVASLIKAALDISKSLKKKAETPSDDFSRKCSLQEFAMARQNNRRPSKIILSARKTSSASPSPLLNYSKSNKMNQLTRNLSYTGTGIVTESTTPPKPVVRTATLTRRSSFPVSLTMGQHILNTKLRRPSMDSFSEDDSSPDHKKRVRMIHRH